MHASSLPLHFLEISLQAQSLPILGTLLWSRREDGREGRFDPVLFIEPARDFYDVLVCFAVAFLKRALSGQLAFNDGVDIF